MTSLSLEAPRHRPGGHILAIEADPQRARALRALFDRRNTIHVTIVSSIEDAVTAINDRVPDLVMTSAFLQPADAERLTAHLRETSGASHVQILIAPAITAPVQARERGGRFRVRGRRAAPPPTACDVSAVLEQVDAYLEQARAALEHRQCTDFSASAPARVTAPLRLVHARADHTADALSDIFERLDLIAGPRRRDRRRAARRPGTDLPWLWSAKLPTGLDLKVVDVSNSGVLVETPTKLSRGTTIELRIVGHETNLSVLARIARTDVAHVDALGVKYHIGAAFARDLELVRPEGLSSDVRPVALADLLSRVLAQADHGSTAALVSFEQELTRLLPVRSVHVRQRPAVSVAGTESVYFSVPGTAGTILQATFDRDCAPSPLEFKLLKAAANLASIVLDFAPPRAENEYPIAAR